MDATWGNLQTVQGSCLIIIVKRVEGWMTLAYHVYDYFYYEVMTIVICDMQSENMKVQCII
jgi:hypothetical protein